MKATLAAFAIGALLLFASYIWLPLIPALAGITYIHPMPICFEDRLANQPFGEITELWFPGYPNLLNEVISGDSVRMSLRRYEDGYGPRCFQIIDMDYETPNGYTHEICGPPGWGSNIAPPCPIKKQGRN